MKSGTFILCHSSRLRRLMGPHPAMIMALMLLLTPLPLPAQTTNDTPHWLGRKGIYQKWGRGISDALTQAADQGNPDAMYGMFMANDRTQYEFQPYSPDALKWLRKAAEAGHDEAQVFFGYSLENRTKPSDVAQAVHWYRLSVAQHHSGGEYRLAICYLRGRGVEQDEERGVELLRHAADEGHRYALMTLADVYARGIAEPRNEKDRPINLLLRAASGGFSPACSTVVARYQQGLGIDRDLIAAALWYCHGAAAFSFGFPLEGKILEGSAESQRTDPFGTALSFFLKAVQRNDTDAMVRIGRMYLDGENVPKDSAAAWQWFNLAANRGSSEAVTARAGVEQKMSADEVATRKSRAEGFGQDLASLAARLPK
jgi:TPR repeat protein